MSVPARTLPARKPRPAPAVPSRRPAPQRKATPSRRSRSRHHVGFAILAGTILTLMVIGIVTLNALLAQASFRLQALETRITGLSERRLTLELEVARLSSPGRIAEWASVHGMELPEQVHLLRVGEARGSGE